MARAFTELDCWQLSEQFKLALYELVDRDPAKKDLKFRDQVRDAAASAPRNIAEGFGRRTDKEFARYLDVARGSLNECQNHLRDAVDRGYLNDPEFSSLLTLSKRAAGAVAGLQRWLRRTK